MCEFKPNSMQVNWAKVVCSAVRVGGHIVIPMTGDIWLKESPTRLLLVQGDPDNRITFEVACMFDAAGYSATLSRKED